MIYIGIDPDTDESGVAVFSEGVLTLHNFDYMTLFESLSNFSSQRFEKVKVVIEKGEQNKAMFAAKHPSNHARDKFAAVANAGSRVGRNYEATNIIEQFCMYLKLDYEFYKPTKAMPKFSNKWAQLQFNMPKKTSNEEQRDALRCIMKYIL